MLLLFCFVVLVFQQEYFSFLVFDFMADFLVFILRLWGIFTFYFLYFHYYLFNIIDLFGVCCCFIFKILSDCNFYHSIYIYIYIYIYI